MPKKELTLDDVMDELKDVKEQNEGLQEQLAEVIEKLANISLDRDYRSEID